MNFDLKKPLVFLTLISMFLITIVSASAVSCENADYEFDISMGVAGKNCNQYIPNKDAEQINVPKEGVYRVFGDVERDQYGFQSQTGEEFQLEINEVLGLISYDDPDPYASYQLKWENLGEFPFFSGWNEVIMLHTHSCPPDSSSNSVGVNKLCLYFVKDIEKCGNGVINEGEDCEQNPDCSKTECDQYDGCYGSNYYDYNDVANDCTDCNCEQNSCTAYTIYYYDERCTECQTDEDCSYLNEYGCYLDSIIYKQGVCENYQCELQSTTYYDCNNLDTSYCSDSSVIYEDFTCENAQCYMFNSSSTSCDDELYCNGQETCEETYGGAICTSGNSVDCSDYNIQGISTCNNNPYTWDYRASFTSVCDEFSDSCTTGDDTITHTCDTSCGAECESNSDCDDTECDYLDKCIENDYYDYHDTTNNCLSDCSCQINVCGQPTIYYYDERCTECQTDEDCSYLNEYGCYLDSIIYKQGVCENYQCELQSTTYYDCNNLDTSYCSDSSVIYEDFTCENAQCYMFNSSSTSCDDELYCNGQETCNLATFTCQSGTEIDCSDNLYCTVNEHCDEAQDQCVYINRDCSYFNIQGISTCNNNPYTWDYRASFTSVCDEFSDSCTTGDDTITHTCDKSQCSAQCTQDSECDDGSIFTNDYCQGCICVNEKIPECSDNYDNDNDGLVDYPDDPGCGSYEDDDEKNPWPECMDGIDNDGDGLIDYPNDPGCDSKFDKTEYSSIIPELFVKRISILNEDYLTVGDDILLVITLYNDGDTDLTDLKITAVIQELGMVKTVGRFDLKKDREITKTILLENIPEIPEGHEYQEMEEYDIRIKVSNDDIARTIHRPVKISH